MTTAIANDDERRISPALHPLGRMSCTEGVRRLAERNQADWLLSDLAAYQVDPQATALPCQWWRLVVNGDRSAVLHLADGDGNPVLRQKYRHTDFPEPGCELLLIDGVLMLREEH
jgi:hypothetical protein